MEGKLTSISSTSAATFSSSAPLYTLLLRPQMQRGELLVVAALNKLPW